MNIRSAAFASLTLVPGFSLSAAYLPKVQEWPAAYDAGASEHETGMSPDAGAWAEDAMQPPAPWDAGATIDAPVDAPIDTTLSAVSPEQPAPARVLAQPATATATATTSTSAIRHTKPHTRRLPIFGLGADVGLPDGANVSLVVRPRSWARFQAAVGSNGISRGYRAGISLVPLGHGPGLAAECGHYESGNANQVAVKLMGSDFQPNPLLERVSYDYLNLHLALNFGYEYVTFFVQAGLSMVRGRLHNTSSYQLQANTLPGNTSVTVREDPVFQATGVAGKLGLLFYVW